MPLLRWRLRVSEVVAWVDFVMLMFRDSMQRALVVTNPMMTLARYSTPKDVSASSTFDLRAFSWFSSWTEIFSKRASRDCISMLTVSKMQYNQARVLFGSESEWQSPSRSLPIVCAQSREAALDGC